MSWYCRRYEQNQMRRGSVYQQGVPMRRTWDKRDRTNHNSQPLRSKNFHRNLWIYKPGPYTYIFWCLNYLYFPFLLTNCDCHSVLCPLSVHFTQSWAEIVTPQVPLTMASQAMSLWFSFPLPVQPHQSGAGPKQARPRLGWCWPQPTLDNPYSPPQTSVCFVNSCLCYRLQGSGTFLQVCVFSSEYFSSF